MAEAEPEFVALMRRVRDGSEDASRQLIAQFEPHVLRVVRRRLNKQLRSKFDSMDFMQAVWASIFADRAKLATFDRAARLLAFLTTVASNMVIEEVRRRLRSEKYNLRHEYPLESAAEYSAWNTNSMMPTPSQFAVAKETWENLLQRQPKPYQRILELRRMGHTNVEIAERLGINEKTIRRVLQKLSEKSRYGLG